MHVGIDEDNYSAYCNFPNCMTWQMVNNFLSGGAAISVLCRQHNINLHIVDAGVNFDFPKEFTSLIRNKAGRSTENFARFQPGPCPIFPLASSFEEEWNTIKQKLPTGLTDFLRVHFAS